MTDEQFDRAKRVFLMVVDLPPEEQPAALARECAGDEALHAEVESLLRHHPGPDAGANATSEHAP